MINVALPKGRLGERAYEAFASAGYDCPAILEKNRSRDKNVNPKGVTGITLWGLYDTISWRASCSPLLFDTGITDPKASFYEFINAAKSMG